MRLLRSPQHHVRYRQRLLASLAAVLAGCLLLVHFWPTPPASTESSLPFSDRPSQRIEMETIQPTRQTQERRPPPPAPLPPVVVPNDRIIETDFEISEGPLPIEDPGDDARRRDGSDGLPTASRAPERSARLLRAVQPRYPDAARKDEVRARVDVAVQVNERGQVTDATILRRWRLDASGSAAPVAALGYGLEAAALAAAQRSLFRPARNGGVPVATETTITFTFGD